MIFDLAEDGLGNVAIANELRKREILAPSAYKYQLGEKKFARYPSVNGGDPYLWSHGTVEQILNNRTYLGELSSLKTETKNTKTKQRSSVPVERQIITPFAHEAIISMEQFELVKQLRTTHRCVAKQNRFNLFRGKLFCECCGHALTISRKQLKYQATDIYLCMNHYRHPEICPQTHRVYHDMLYPYVLQQVQSFAKTMKRRKVNATVKEYTDIQELTPEILNTVIDRIEISHVGHKSKPGNVIHIYWKLQ